jgi:tetratricopeptide (TPR) repeat protein
MSGDNNRSLASKLRKHSVLLKRVFIIVTILTIIGISVWIYINNNRKSITNNDDQTDTASSEAVGNIISGNYDAGQKVLDDSLDKTTDAKEQAWIYIQKASVAVNLNKYDEAYDFAKKAEELNPDINSAQMMAVAAAKKGDNTDAIAKYQLALSRITGTSGMDDLDRSSIQTEIDKLKE